MCGIVAVLTFSPAGLYPKDLDIFQQLHKSMALRGEDGSGIYFVGDKKSGLSKLNDDEVFLSWVKNDTIPHDLYYQKDFTDRVDIIKNSRFLVGHTRWATQGDITTANAHPFQYKHITLVHNGNIQYAPDTKAMKKYNVDSMALADSLSRSKDVKETLNRTTGAIATIWYDEIKKTINIYRNSERPLKFVELYNGLYIASEAGVLSWVMKRNHYGGDTPKIKEFPEGWHFEWTHEGKLTKTKVKEVHHYHYPRQNRQWGFEDDIPFVGANDDDEVPSEAPSEPIKLLPPPLTPSVAAAVVLPAKSEDDNDPPKSHYKGIPEYMGLKKDDVVIFDVANHMILEKDRPTAAVDGLFIGTKSQTVGAMGMLEDITIHTNVKADNKEELERLLKRAFFKGKIVSILMDTVNLTDVKVYLVETTAVTEEEKTELWKSNQIIHPYRKDFAPERTLH